MYIIANFLSAVTMVLDFILNFFLICIFIRAILSWVNPDPYNVIVQTLYRVTEPILSTVRKWFPFCYMGGMDLSPIVACLVIYFLREFAIKSLAQTAVMMQHGF